MGRGKRFQEGGRRTVCADMVYHGLVGVRFGDLAQRLVARDVSGVEQHLEVHHIIDDHRELHPVLRIPTARAADDGVEARGQRRGERLDSFSGGLVLRVAV
jgi:hypothetical protein